MERYLNVRFSTDLLRFMTHIEPGKKKKMIQSLHTPLIAFEIDAILFLYI